MKIGNIHGIYFIGGGTTMSSFAMLVAIIFVGIVIMAILAERGGDK